MVGTSKIPTAPPSSSSSPNDQSKSEDVQKKEEKPVAATTVEKVDKKNHAKAPKKPAAPKSLRRMPSRHIQVSWESFPYSLCKTTEELLLSTAHLHLVHKKKMASTIPCLSRFLLLSGLQGSEIYQESLLGSVAQSVAQLGGGSIAAVEQSTAA